MRIVYAILNKIILWAFNSRSRSNDKFNRDFLSNRRSPEDHARKSWGNVTRCVMLLSNLLTDDTCKIINSTTRSGVRLVWAYVSENELDLYFQAHLHREKCKEESDFTSLSCLSCMTALRHKTLQLFDRFVFVINQNAFQLFGLTRWQRRFTPIVLYAICGVNGSSLTRSLTIDTFDTTNIDCYELIFKLVMWKCC